MRKKSVRKSSDRQVLLTKLMFDISHELRQPLSAIKGFAQVAFLESKEDSKIRQDLAKIIEQSIRVEEIIRYMQSFPQKPASKGKGDSYKRRDSHLCWPLDQKRLQQAFLKYLKKSAIRRI